jgi:methionyl-tRNA formyltransferase
VFAGTAAFAGPSLRRLADAGHEIALVLTQPDRPAGRGMRTLSSSIKLQAAEMGLPIYQPERIRDEAALTRIREVDADLMVVVAYGQILPANLINAPRLGTLNVHASLLPRHRGPAPIEWAILKGDTETGVTIMQMDAGVDTGPILAQERVALGANETAPELEDRLGELGARLLVHTIGDLLEGRVQPVPQGDAGATHAPRLKTEDGKLNPPAMPAAEIDRRVRALGQRIGTWITLAGGQVKVLHGHLGSASGDGVAVPTSDGTYTVDEVQPPGGRPMSAAAWMRGRR